MHATSCFCLERACTQHQSHTSKRSLALPGKAGPIAHELHDSLRQLQCRDAQDAPSFQAGTKQLHERLQQISQSQEILDLVATCCRYVQRFCMYSAVAFIRLPELWKIQTNEGNSQILVSRQKKKTYEAALHTLQQSKTDLQESCLHELSH